MVDTVQTLTSLLSTFVTNTVRGISGNELSDGIYSTFNRMPWVAKAVDYTATQDDGLIDVTTDTSTITITLPAVAAARVGQMYSIRKVDAAAGTLTVDGDGAETLNGVASKDITTQWDGMLVINTGIEWAAFALTGAT